MATLDDFLNVVNQVNRDYTRISIPTNEIKKNFGRKSVDELESSREFYYLCCLERNLVVGHRARQHGIPSRLVMLKIDRPFQIVRIGAAVEFDTEDGTFTYVGSISGDKIIDSVYPYRKSHSNTRHLDTKYIDTSKSWFENFGLTSLDDIEGAFPGFNSSNFFLYLAALSYYFTLGKAFRKIEKKGELRLQI